MAQLEPLDRIRLQCHWNCHLGLYIPVYHRTVIPFLAAVRSACSFHTGFHGLDFLRFFLASHLTCPNSRVGKSDHISKYIRSRWSPACCRTHWAFLPWIFALEPNTILSLPSLTVRFAPAKCRLFSHADFIRFPSDIDKSANKRPGFAIYFNLPVF